MKKGCFSVLLMMIVFAIQCAQFPSRYERIESDKIRTNGFVFEPYAEAAPGDTMRVTMHFGGKPIESVSFQMSYSHAMTPYGDDTVMDIFDLPICSASLHLPDSLEVAFVIPESTFFLTKGISQTDIELLKKALPASMQFMSQKDMAAFLNDFVKVNLSDNASLMAFASSRWGGLFGASASPSAAIDSLTAVAGILLNVFSVPAVIYAHAKAKDGDQLKIKGDFAIRYNNHLQKTPLRAIFPVNNSPKIRWLGVYKIKKRNATSFFPTDTAYGGNWSLQYLYNELYPDSVHDTLVVDTGYTYFIAADSGMVRYTILSGTTIIDGVMGADTIRHILQKDSIVADTSRDRMWFKSPKTGRDTSELETFFYDWQYENLDLDSTSMPLDSLTTISPSGNSIALMLPSIDVKFTHTRIWLTAYDFFLGAFNRPTAFTFRQIDAYFSYTDAYRKSKK
jgi:hypothetical protein